MNSRLGWIFAAAIGLGGCTGTGKEPSSDAGHAVNEGSAPEPGAIRLSPDAVIRFGIETGQVDSTIVPSTWSHSGQIVPLPGGAIVVSAPVAGSVLAPIGGQLPISGHRVGKGDTLLRLLPPDVDSATAEVGSVDPEPGAEAAAFAVVAPDAGVVRTMNVSLGQLVPAGAGLVEVVGVDRLWVRLVLEPKDARPIARAEAATVSAPGRPTRLRAFAAQPVTNLQFTDSASGSVDLFYEIRGAVRVLWPGERVIVALPLSRPKRRALAAPIGAVVVDSRGGTWIYQRLDPVSFARRRVRVSRVVADQAILAEGPAPGTSVVTAGSAELFGTESRTAK